MVHAHNHYLYFTNCMLRSKWANILELVQCEIVNVISGDEIDAYMLRYVHVCNNGWIASYISLIHSHTVMKVFIILKISLIIIRKTSKHLCK